MHTSMRGFRRPAFQGAASCRRHTNTGVSSSVRTLDLQEYERRHGETKEKLNEKPLAKQSSSGLRSLSALNPCRKPYMVTSKIPSSLNSENPNMSMGCYRHLGAVAGKQSKSKIEDDIENAFERASTIDELKRAFKAMESVLDDDDKRLGLACLRMGQEFESAGMSPETVLAYAKRALRIFETDAKDSVMIAMALHLMGTVHYTLKKFDESLGYLNRANKLLEKLEKEGTQFQTKPIAFAVQLLLGDAKTALGRREEALINYTRSLALKEEVLEPDHPQLAVSCRQVAEAYVAVLNFKEALPLCLKALEIHRIHLGQNSVEVAADRRLLAVIYSGLGDHKKALEENSAAKKVLKNWGMDSELVYAELDTANVQISLGNYNDAITILRGIVQHTEKESELRAMVLLYMSKALCNLKKYADSKKCCELATNLFKRYETTNPAKVAEAYTELAMLYETMNEFATAISLYKTALGIYEKSPQDQHAEASTAGRLGWLLMLTGSVREAIPYLESAVERLKESFGPNHFGIAYIYNNLGAAYEELERPQAAAQMFAMAKEIMETALGPQHIDTIETMQNLANVHGSMGSFGIAIEFQRRVVEALENHGPTVKDELKEAKRCLLDLQRRAKQPAGMAVKNAIPHHSITGKLLTKTNVSQNASEESDASQNASEEINASEIASEEIDASQNASDELNASQKASEEINVADTKN